VSFFLLRFSPACHRILLIGCESSREAPRRRSHEHVCWDFLRLFWSRIVSSVTSFPRYALRIKLLVSCTDQWAYRDGAGTLVFSRPCSANSHTAQQCIALEIKMNSGRMDSPPTRRRRRCERPRTKPPEPASPRRCHRPAGRKLTAQRQT
jgi:hypothetical protein